MEKQYNSARLIIDAFVSMRERKAPHWQYEVLEARSREWIEQQAGPIEKSPHTATDEEINNGTPTLDSARTTTNCDRCGKPGARNINALPDSIETAWDIERNEAAKHQIDMERLTLTEPERAK